MVDLTGSPVPKFNWANASVSSWKKFETHVKVMVKGPLKGKSEDVHCAFLLLWLGETGRYIFSAWNLAPGEVDTLDGYLAKFKAHIEPIANPIVARCKFYQRSQKPGETMEQFITDLRLLAQPCDFKENTGDEMIRDRIMCGVESDLVRKIN